ncbi:MAG: hypothetical protein LQ350_006296 [Teloschistes chrysophthalmus]|nr:MAG: hypothetical protein LQ350_006296 [Niorma chrysophthalma]
MDTSAYLTRQGWLGDGNALHPSGHGIKKPLLVARKTNTLGLGKKAHDAYADQWWSRAFEETLGSLNDSFAAEKTTRGSGAKSSLVGVPSRARWVDPGGLYGGFVRGAGLDGTIGIIRDTEVSEKCTEPPRKKRRVKGHEFSSNDEYTRSPFEIEDQDHNQKPPPEQSKFIAVTLKSRDMKKPYSREQGSLAPGPPLQGVSKKGKPQIEDRELAPQRRSPKLGTHVSQGMGGTHEEITEDKNLHQQSAVKRQGSGNAEHVLHPKKRKRKNASAAILMPEPVIHKDLSDHGVSKRKKKQRRERHE